MLANTILVCAPLFALAVLRVPLIGAGRRAVTRRMDIAIDMWISTNRVLLRSMWLVDFEIDWPAAGLSRRNWYVVTSNHQSWADILLLQEAFRSTIPPLKFFTKRELIWLPLVGLAMYLLGFPYVRRLDKAQLAANPALKHADRDSTIAACAGLRTHPTAVLIFLEGTRFTLAKRGAHNSRFRHLLNPRAGGLGYVLSGLKDELAQLIDVTIIYPDGPPTFWGFLEGRCRRARMTVKVHDLDGDLRSEDAHMQRKALLAFVDDIWRAKDERLNAASRLLSR